MNGRIIVAFLGGLLAFAMSGCGGNIDSRPVSDTSVKTDVEDVAQSSATEDGVTADTEEQVSNDNAVEADDEVSENPLQDFYNEFMERGTVDNIEDIAKEYDLFVDFRKTGTGRELFKVAETREEAKVTSNNDAYKGDYYVRIECTILGNKTVDAVVLVDNRSESASD